MNIRSSFRSPFWSDPVALGRVSWRQILAAVLAVLLLTALWRLPSPAWACGSLDRSDTCQASFRLEPTDLGFEPAALEPGSVAITPAGDELVVAFRSADDASVARAALVRFDATSGRQLEIVVRAEEDLLPEAPVFSSDGSVMAVAVSRPFEDTLAWSAIMVVNQSTGDRSFALEYDWLNTPDAVDPRAVEWRSCHENGMRLSSDGSSILCKRVIDVATGDFATADGTVGYMDPAAEVDGPFTGPVVNRGRLVGTIAVVEGSDGQRLLKRRHVWWSGDSVTVESDELNYVTQRFRSEREEFLYRTGSRWERSFMGLRSDEERVFTVAIGNDRRWLPRWLQPVAEVGLLRLDSELDQGVAEILEHHKLPFVPTTGAWDPNGSWYLLIDDRLMVTRFAAT